MSGALPEGRRKADGQLPESWPREARRLWHGLPEDKRNALLRTAESLPGDMKGWRALIEEAAEHVQRALGDRSAVVIVGPANVGKSTLYNALIQEGQAHAEVSAVPGTTRRPQQASGGVFTIIDTPGADAAGPLGDEERKSALAVAAEGDVQIVMFDAAHGIRAPEQQLMTELRAQQRPSVVALNKVDLIPAGERDQVRDQAANALGIEPQELILLSALERRGLEQLLLKVASAEPGILAALGAALPAYRWSLAQSAIAKATSTAAAIAVTPIPIVDFVPLLGVQVSMVLSLARVFDYKITLARARELLVTFGAGLLGRTVFYELSKLGGPPGWLVAAAVAAGTTAALGYGSAVWFDRGAKVSSETLREVGRAVAQSVVERLKDLGRRRPDRRTLRQRIRSALADMPELQRQPERGDSPRGGATGKGTDR